MQSQIGQVSPSQAGNPLLASVGKSNEKTPADAQRNADTFQSVLAGVFGSTRKNSSEEAPANRPDTSNATDGLDTDEGGDLKVDLSDEEIAAALQDMDDIEQGLDVSSQSEDVRDSTLGERSIGNAELESDTQYDDMDNRTQPATAGESGPSQPSLDANELGEGASERNKARPNAAVPAWFPLNQATGETRPAGEPANGVAPSSASKNAANLQDLIHNKSKLAATGLNERDGALGKTGLSETAAEKSANALPNQDLAGAKSTIAANKEGVLNAQQKGAVAAAHASAERSTARERAEARLAGDEPRTGAAIQRTATNTSSIPTAPAAPVSAQAAATTARQVEAANGSRAIRWTTDLGFTSDVSAPDMQAPARVVQTALLQQPDLPRNIAAQIAQAFRNGGGERPMELVLSPAELGRVRISMQAIDGGLTIQVVADRTETLDLMRRHINDLAQEFHAIGYGSAEFAFGHSAPDSGTGSNGNETGDDLLANVNSDETAPAQDKTQPPTLAIHADRVDIRL